MTGTSPLGGDRSAPTAPSWRVGLLGLGAWAEGAHLPALRSLAGVGVVACAGADRAEAEAFARRHGVERACGSLEELLAGDGLDALVVAAPDHVHPAAVAAALAAALPVFCEKPLARTLAEAEQLGAAPGAALARATVGFSFRYSPAIQQLLADLAAGRLGEPWLLELSEYNSQFHPAFGRSPSWKADPAAAGGGALFEYGSHALDLAQLLAGPIERVSSHLARRLPGARLDDVATLQLAHRNGCQGVLVCGWVLAGGYPGIRVRLHGSEGAAEAELTQREAGAESYLRLPLDGGAPQAVGLPALSGREAYVRRHLADFLALEPPPPVPVLPGLADGIDVQRVLAASLAATERWVSVERPPAVSEPRAGRGLPPGPAPVPACAPANSGPRRPHRKRAQ